MIIVAHRAPTETVTGLLTREELQDLVLTKLGLDPKICSFDMWVEVDGKRVADTVGSYQGEIRFRVDWSPVDRTLKTSLLVGHGEGRL